MGGGGGGGVIESLFVGMHFVLTSWTRINPL